MNARAVAKGTAILSNILLGVSLLLVLVWWAMSVRLFVAGWALYGLAYLIGRSAAMETAALAMPDQIG